jgi:hypothetical protein
VERRPPTERWRLACAALALVGCERQASSLSGALDRAQPHLAHFAEFDAWARRARQSDAALGSRAALGETVFAKIRTEPGVIAAWIDVQRRNPERLALPAGVELPAAAVWVPIRTPALGPLRVAVQEPCSIRLAQAATAAEPSCVLIQRALPSAPAEQLMVTVAYRPGPTVPQ